MAFLPSAQVTRVISDRETIGSGKTDHILALSLTSCVPAHSGAPGKAGLSHHTLAPVSCAVNAFSLYVLHNPAALCLVMFNWHGNGSKSIVNH